jgi:hypothetical protein
VCPGAEVVFINVISVASMRGDGEVTVSLAFDADE